MRSLDPPVVTTPAAEPAYCPRCGLRHTRRSDWLCPRCGSPVDTDVPASPAAPAPEHAPGFPLASRIAGALLVAAAAAFTGGVARELVTLSALARHGRLLAAVAVLAALGLSLLLGSSLARWAAAILAAAAAVVLAEGLLRDVSPGLLRDPLPVPLRQLLRDLVPDHRPTRILALLGLDAGGLLLTVGRPGARRLAAGVLLAAPLLVLQALAALRG